MLSSMLRFISIFLFAVTLSPSIAIASSDSLSLSNQIQPLAIKSIILDIAVKDETMVAVGERGHIFIFDEKSTPKWRQVLSPTSSHLTKVFFITPLLGWAVGHDATIIHTQDAGLTWQVQMSSPEIEKPLMDVLFFDTANGVAIGAYGLFYRTDNGGKNWTPEYHEELLFEEDIAYLAELKAEDEALYLSERSTLLPHFNRIIATNDGRLIMVGELGLVSVSDDGGINWQKLDFVYEGSLFNVIESGRGFYVMGLRGNIFQTGLDLNRWEQVMLPTKSTINGAILAKDGGLRVVGNAGVILDITANGKGELVTQRQGENLVSIARDPQGHIWVAGTKGLFELK
ncbi:WD40/YVTN/BNR-like repeat-containing protein [Shewanella woodyi]|uniref:WD40/YVTN/BNR-like repeat-containing protein n=1 Tax=Shewanella woodyi TaxID=60961 RepID=UPI003749EB80